MREETKPFTAALTGKAAILAAAFCALTASAVEVRVDFSKDVRPVKPMHAVGQPPLLGLRDYQLFRYLKEAGVPYARLHDIGSSVPQCRYHMVDIPNVFPDFDADENDPANYDFLYTDKMLAALIANGVEPWFRLGVSIENDCKALDDAGYAHTELSLNEWLPVPSRKTLGTATQAADVCAEMLGLQGTSLDSAMIYDARCGLGIFSPLFNPYDYSPHKAYYAFKAFNELYKRGTEVESSSSDRWVTWVAAARGEKDGAVVIAHTGDKEVPLVLELCGRNKLRPSPRGGGVKCKVRECRITDETRTNEIVPPPTMLPPHSFLVVTVDCD